MNIKVFILLLALPVSSIAQNTVSIIHSPSDMAIGLRYDRQIKNSGLYIAFSKGGYQISEEERILNHNKSVAGYVRYIDSAYPDAKTYLSIGVSHHYYSGMKYDPFSIDLGSGVKFKGVMIGFVFDFFKWEGGVNFGVNF